MRALISRDRPIQGFQESQQILLLLTGEAYFQQERRFSFFLIATPVVIVDHSLKCREAPVVHIWCMRGHIVQARCLESASITFLLRYRKAALVVVTHPGILEFVVAEIRAVMTPRATCFRYEEHKTVLLMQSERAFVPRCIAIESGVGSD